VRVLVVGFLGVVVPGPFVAEIAAAHQGLADAGYVEGQNVQSRLPTAIWKVI